MVVLVTATKPRGNNFAKNLNIENIPVVYCPALNVYPITTPCPMGIFDAMILTSRNAVIDGLPSLPVIAVGYETAALARARGLEIIQTGKGGIADLDLQSYKNILYPCAANPTFIPDNVTPWPVYETRKNLDFSIRHDITHICVFSIKAAIIIKPFIQPHHNIIALSPAIGKIFKDEGIQNLVTCDHPRYDEMKKLIEELL